MNSSLSDDEMQALAHIAGGRDPFTGCNANGDFGKRMRILAALRRAGVIDHHDHITELGRNVLVRTAA